MTPTADPAATPRAEQTRNAIAHWEKNRAVGRTDFILRRGVIGWGFPTAVLTIAYRIVQEQGIRTAPHMTDSLRAAAVVAFVVFPLCGWLFGRWLWRTGEARYRSMVGVDRTARAGAPRSGA